MTAVFQSPSAPKPIAVRHQPLNADTWQLGEAVKILERIGEGPKPPSSSNARSPASIRAAVRSDSRRAPSGPQLRRDHVLAVVFVDELRRSSLRDTADGRRQVTNAIAVDRGAERDLGGDLVALGHGDLAHVVAEARNAHLLRFTPGGGSTAQAPMSSVHRRVLPVADYRLARACRMRVAMSRTRGRHGPIG